MRCLGLELAINMDIKVLKVIEDSNLVVMQVNIHSATQNTKLRRYRNTVWNSIELLDAFSIEAVKESRI